MARSLSRASVGGLGGGDAEAFAGQVARQQRAQPGIVVHHQDVGILRISSSLRVRRASI